MDILALLQCIEPCLTGRTIKQLSRIIEAMMVMTGRVTMLGIARWAGTGGSYRTVQRFYATVIPWTTLFWLFFREHLWQVGDTYLLAGDEVVMSKAGKQTHGLDRFFSSLYGKPIAGISFFALSLVSVQERRAYPSSVKQVVRDAAEKAASKAKAQSKKKESAQSKGKVGRPKGSKNKPKVVAVLSAEVLRIQAMVMELLQRIAGSLSLTYLVMDGHFGNNNALTMVRSCGLHLISKLRYDARLYLPYTGPYAGRGPHRHYGDRVVYHSLPAQSHKTSAVAGAIQTDIYQMHLLHKEFSQALNVVIIVKTNLTTGACARVCLFSSDLALTYEQLIDYYSLRFQIEFNFRDAKQFWGLDDFMNLTPTSVNNAANLALFMVNVSHLLLRHFRQTYGTDSGILDLKAFWRGIKYAQETLKLLPQSPDPILLTNIVKNVTRLGRIHPVHSHSVTS